MAKVKIYSTPTCPYCKKAKAFLTEHKISFEDIDVGSDQKAAEEMMERSGEMGVPQIDIDGKLIIGFDQAAIAQALGISA
ncbi:glutaredoxin family protein [Candidatus Margulisiibacteriota bacterium]